MRRLITLLTFAPVLLALHSLSAQTTITKPSAAQTQALAQTGYGNLPLSFTANQGQTDPRVRFTSQGSDYSLFLTDNEAVLALSKASRPNHQKPGAKAAATPSNLKGDVLRMSLSGAERGSQAVGETQLPGTANYFLGNDPDKWRTSVPTYAKVKYNGVYKGIDLVYYGNQRQLEYDFVVAPHANPDKIRIHFAGAKKLSINSEGDLEITTGNSQTAFRKPQIYQNLANHKTNVDGSFTLLGHNTVGFKVSSFSHGAELIVDPVLAYSTYLGGSYIDYANAIAVDSSGSAYVTGNAGSSDFPVTSGAFQTICGDGECAPAFITKFNPQGTALEYSTYLGGLAGPAIGFAIAVDSSGNAYVTGRNDSTTFPVTKGALQTQKDPDSMGESAFVTKLNPSGTALVYSTYLSGNYEEVAYGLAIDSSGDAFVTGFTDSTNFPVTPGAYQPVNNSAANHNPNAFVTKLNPQGSALVYGTYLGGRTPSSQATQAYSIAVDSSGYTYVTGNTAQPDFPVTAGAFQTKYKAASSQVGQVFVTKFNPSGNDVIYSTFLGGSDQTFAGDTGTSIAADGAGNAYITGYTEATDFPVTKGAFQTTNNATGSYYGDAFVSKLNPEGTALVYSTFLGGVEHTYSGNEGTSISFDQDGDACVVGLTYSTAFPVTKSAFQTTNNDSLHSSAFLVKLNSSGASLSYATYLGGGVSDQANGVASDDSGNCYVTGLSDSQDFPVTAGAFQTSNHSMQTQIGGPNAFVTKFNLGDTVSAVNTETTLTSSANPAPTAQAITFSAKVTPATGTTIPAGTVAFSMDGNGASTVALNASGVAVYTDSALAAGTHTIEATYSGSTSFTGSSASLTQTITTAALTISVTPATLTFASLSEGSTSPAQIITLKNTGKTAITLGATTFTGTNTKSFLKSATTCGSSLAAAANCTLSIEFHPAVIGSLSASLNIIDNATGSPQLVTLKGTATAAAPTYTLTANPATLTFASLPEGSTSAAQTITLKNTGTGAINLGTTTFTGTNPRSFLVSAKTCTTSLATGASCTISIEYKPAVIGSLSASLSIADNATGSPQLVALKGTSTAAAPTYTLAVTPAALTFASLAEGATSAAQTIMLKNTGTAALTLGTSTFIGTNPKSFLISAKTCTTSLDAGASCSLSIVCKPAVTGSLSASLSIVDNATYSPQLVALKGMATAAAPALTIAVSPTALTFASTSLGVATKPQLITLKNTGSDAVMLAPATFTGTNPRSFVVSAKTCTTSLAAGASCTLSIVCNPAVTGSLSASLNIADNAVGSPQLVALKGSGTSAAK